MTPERLPSLRILMTAVGAPGAPAIMRSLRLNGEREVTIIGTDMTAQPVGRYLADAFHPVPPGLDPDYIRAMLEIVQREKPAVLLPLSTYELQALSENRARFEALGCKVLVSRSEALAIANDKARLYEFLRSRGVPTPDFVRARTAAEVEDAVHKLGYPEVPVCFKPAFGKGGRGFRVLDPGIDRTETLFGMKPDSTRTTLEEVLPVLKEAPSLPEILVMEVLPGMEYSVDLLLQDGTAFYAIPRSRELIKLGISAAGRVEDNPEVREMAEAICKAVGLDYNVNVQLKIARDGIPKVLEINPRVSGTLVLCHGAGVNLAYYAVKLALGEGVPRVSVRYGTWMVRFWDEIFVAPEGKVFRLG